MVTPNAAGPLRIDHPPRLAPAAIEDQHSGSREAPHRVVHTWHVSTDPDHSSEVEVRFAAMGAHRTRVTLEHRHWERMSGERAAVVRGNYDNGWEGVFVKGFGAYAGIEGEAS